MPFNGSGIFSRLYSWTADAANSIKIRADRMDAEFNGIATALTNAILRDGTGKPTANIDFNNKRITVLAAPVDVQDAARKAEIDTEAAARLAGDSANATAAAGALTAANTAQSSANSANTAAANAQTSANTAQATANSANTAAANAQSSANAATTKLANVTGLEVYASSFVWTAGLQSGSFSTGAIAGLTGTDSVFTQVQIGTSNSARIAVEARPNSGSLLVEWYSSVTNGSNVTVEVRFFVVKRSAVPPSV
jgi:hypothetical protein